MNEPVYDHEDLRHLGEEVHDGETDGETHDGEDG